MGFLLDKMAEYKFTKYIKEIKWVVGPLIFSLFFLMVYLFNMTFGDWYGIIYLITFLLIVTLYIGHRGYQQRKWLDETLTGTDMKKEMDEADKKFKKDMDESTSPFSFNDWINGILTKNSNSS